MTEPNNLNMLLCNALTPFAHQTSPLLTTERSLVQDTLKVLAGLESNTYIRDNA
jgi:hypothetical protein